MKKPLTLSIVIPAYNESRYIEGCLSAIAGQEVMPDEVIVVDNGSTDDTAKKAAQFPFVRVINEPKPGITSARNRGFNAAKSDLIGRVDADSRIAPDWAGRVKADFIDKELKAVTGPGLAFTFSENFGLRSRAWSIVYLMASNSFFHARILWGANMAIRNQIWQSIRSETSTDDKLVHEDQDLSLLLAGHGYKVKQDFKLLIDTESRASSYHKISKFKQYIKRSQNTKKLHDSKGTLKKESALSYPFSLWALGVVICAIPSLTFVISSYIWHWLRLDRSSD